MLGRWVRPAARAARSGAGAGLGGRRMSTAASAKPRTLYDKVRLTPRASPIRASSD